MFILDLMAVSRVINKQKSLTKTCFGWIAFLLSSTILLNSFIQKISIRGGFDWDELYLIRAASFGNFSDFLRQIWPEPTPPLQAVLFKVLVVIGLEPTEVNMRSINLIGWAIVFGVSWYFAVKNNYQFILLILLILTSINFYPLSYVAQARPYFFGFFLMILFALVWLRDFSQSRLPSKLLLLITVLASLVHVYGAIVCGFIYLFWSVLDRKFLRSGILSSVAPYSIWFLISVSNAEDKVARVAWMVVPNWENLIVHLKDQLFGGSESFYIVMLGLLLGLILVSIKLLSGKALERIETAQIILLLSFVSTLLFAYFGSNFIPIWYPRNFIFALPCILLASAVAYFRFVSSVIYRNKLIVIPILGLALIVATPIAMRALYNPNNVMSQGSYRDASSYAVGNGYLRNGDTVIGWEDTQVYEFYLSKMELGRNLSLNYQSRFAADSILALEPRLIVIAADGQIDTAFIDKMNKLGFFCLSTQALKGNIVTCEKPNLNE
jgi:hypothetical protein